MKKWRLMNEYRKKETEEEEKEESTREINSILFEETLKAEVLKSLEQSHTEISSPRSKTIHLPSVQQYEEQEDEHKVTSPLRLPMIGKKTRESKSAHEHGSMSARTAQTQEQTQAYGQTTGSQTVRLDRTLAGQTYHAASMSGLPSARPTFLKETAAMIRRMTSVIHDKGEAQVTPLT